MPQTRRQKIGRWGEAAAAHYLEGKGYSILERNVRTVYGEIDLIAGKGDCMVFVEVKTRTGLQFGYPEQAVTAKKLEHMVAAAQFYLQNHPDLAGSWQIDVIAIQSGEAVTDPSLKGVEVEHFENITG